MQDREARTPTPPADYSRPGAKSRLRMSAGAPGLAGTRTLTRNHWHFEAPGSGEVAEPFLDAQLRSPGSDHPRSGVGIRRGSLSRLRCSNAPLGQASRGASDRRWGDSRNWGTIVTCWSPPPATPRRTPGEWLACVPVSFAVERGAELRAAVSDLVVRLAQVIRSSQSGPRGLARVGRGELRRGGSRCDDVDQNTVGVAGDEVALTERFGPQRFDHRQAT